MCPITFFWDGFKLEKAVSICFGLIIFVVVVVVVAAVAVVVVVVFKAG